MKRPHNDSEPVEDNNDTKDKSNTADADAPNTTTSTSPSVKRIRIDTDDTTKDDTPNKTTPNDKTNTNPPNLPQIIIYDFSSPNDPIPIFDVTRCTNSNPTNQNGTDDDNTNRPTQTDHLNDLQTFLDALYNDEPLEALLSGSSNDKSDARKRRSGGGSGGGGSGGNNGDDDSDSDSDSDSESRESSPSPPSSPPIVKTFCELEQDVNTLDDLIEIGLLYEADDYPTKTYSVNIEGIHRMIPALREFKEMIGLDTIKRQVVDQIVYLSGKGNHQQFSSASACSGNDDVEERVGGCGGGEGDKGDDANNEKTGDDNSASTGTRRRPTSSSRSLRHSKPLPPRRSHSTSTALSTSIQPFQPRKPRKPTKPDRSSKDPSTSLFSQLFSSFADTRGRKATGASQFKMSESVTHDDNAYDMFHTVIYGPPGVGKTAFAKVLARLFLNLGITQNDTFRVARRSDLIGEYVGHTATKTQKVIDEAMGGVLFIDEVYALGNGGTKRGNGDSKSDSFSTECINTLNQNLTERKGEFICIIAGYKTETERHFFDLNPGLRRRFSFYYTIDAYDWNELTRILLFKINKLVHWRTTNGLDTALLDTTSFLKDKMDDFPHYAGDVETWLLNIKIAHCKRVFGKREEVQRVITMEDIEAGYARYVVQKRGDEEAKKREREEMVRHLYV